MRLNSDSLQDLFQKLKSVTFVCLITVGMLACNNKEDAPKIPADKFEKILVDMQAAEIYSVAVASLDKQELAKSDQDTLTKYYGILLQHHNVSFEDVQQTLNWYFEHPNEYSTLLIRVGESLRSNKKHEVGTSLDRKNNEATNTDELTDMRSINDEIVDSLRKQEQAQNATRTNGNRPSGRDKSEIQEQSDAAQEAIKNIKKEQ